MVVKSFQGRFAGLFLAWVILMPAGYLAPSLAQSANTKQPTEVQRTAKAMAKVAVRGPKDIPLKLEGVLKLPDGMIFVKQPEAGNYMRAIGNSNDPTLLGLIFPSGKKEIWMATLEYVKSGYIRDGDAREWKSDALLESLKQGTQTQNKERVARGFKALEIIGWVEEPKYDKLNNRLVWSLLAKDKGDDDKQVKSINYNTYALGRGGYFALDLITSDKVIDHDKLEAQKLLANLSFYKGRRYADFDEKTDKVAAFGLTALVGGGLIAKKLGLFGVLSVFLLKAWKLVLVGFALLAGTIGKLFGRGRSNSSDA